MGIRHNIHLVVMKIEVIVNFLSARDDWAAHQRESSTQSDVGRNVKDMLIMHFKMGVTNMAQNAFVVNLGRRTNTPGVPGKNAAMRKETPADHGEIWYTIVAIFDKVSWIPPYITLNVSMSMEFMSNSGLTELFRILSNLLVKKVLRDSM